MPASDHSRFWIAAQVFLALSLVVLPASLGGAPEWTTWVLFLLSAAAFGCWFAGAARNHRRWGAHPALLVPVVLLVVTAFQLVPLPPALLSVLSPRQAELREFALVPLGLTSWRPLAVDPPATARGFARLLSLGLLFFVALELGRLEGVRRRLFAVLALSGAAISAIGFVHLLAGLDALFGAYHFSGNVPLITPFGNTNHLSSFLMLAGTVGFGLAFGARSRDAAIGWAVTALACALGVFFTFSRGGIATLIATWGFVGVATLSRRGGGGLRGALPWAFIAATLLVAVFLSFEQFVERAETLSSIEKFKATKLDLWPMFASGLAPYWLLGMGAGGFELGFAPAQTREFTVTFTHPEALPLQWVADFGVPLALLAAVAGLALAWRGWKATRPDQTANIAFIGVLGLALHDVFDFALELNAVAPAGAIIAGLVFALEAPVQRRPTRWTLGAPVAAASVLAAGLLAFGLPGYLSAEHELQESIRAAHPFVQTRAKAVSLINRHPADWVLYGTVSADAGRRADPREALAWINRVLSLRPSDVNSHLAAAQALLRLKQPMQALAEYKLAWANGDSQSLAAGLSLALTLNALDRVLIERPGHLERLYWLLRQQGKNTEALALIEAALALPPTPEVETEAHLYRVRHEVDLGSPEAALLAIEQLPPSLAERSETVMNRVTALQKLKRQDEAIVALERLLVREPSNVGVGFALVDLLGGLQRPVAAREVLMRVRPFASTSYARSQVFQREASLWMQEERWPRAIEALQTASRIEPSNPSLHYRLAEVFERMGSLHSALDSLKRGTQLDTPQGAQAQAAWVQRLELRLGQ